MPEVNPTTLPEDAPQETIEITAEIAAESEPAGADPELMRRMAEEQVTRLEYEGKTLILIATAHVSQESAQLVKYVIEEERPDSVCIELDEGRFNNLQNPKAWENTDVVQVIRSKRVGFMLANLALSAYQRRMAKQLDTRVGGEMLQGIESARECGAQLMLADRDIQTTFMRIWRALGFREKLKLLMSLFVTDEEDLELDEASLQELMQKDMLESMLASMREEFPAIGQTLVNERDQYLANKIKNAPGPKVVAVLGGAHVPGVSEEVYREQDMETISAVPAKTTASRLKGWIIPAIIIGLIVYGFVTNIQTGLSQLSAWVVWNGGLAALMTLLCLGHPLSILTAFVAAPITSLNPFLACGWFAGLVEAALRKPTVQDVQRVPEDIFSVKGFFRNRFLRILLVVVMANIGSTIGTFIAGADIIQKLF